MADDNLHAITMQINGRLRIAALTFLALYLELVCIRWLGAEMKLFAYFKNFVLMASFAGLGLGCAYPVSAEPKWRWLPWGILLLVIVCSTTTATGLALAFFPDAGVFQWNGSLASPDLRAQFERFLPMLPSGQSATAFFIEVTVALLALTYGILALIVTCFFSIGRSLAFAFERERPLTAYTADIAGSLAGTLVAAVVAWLGAPPVVWIAIVGVTLVALDRDRRVMTSVAMTIAVSVAAWQYLGHPELVWSPYYQIQVDPTVSVKVDGVEKHTGWSVKVNNSAFQVFEDFSPTMMSLYQSQLSADRFAFLEGSRQRHELPFKLGANLERTLVIGAGTGNDVAAALRLGAGHVDAVDIDPAILNIGRKLHPERPYDSDRVRVITDDARAFIESTPEKYDLIVFGTLDSQTAVSAQSSLRLEYFVYSEESFRKVATLLKPNGLLVVAFGTGWRPWVTERMAATVKLGFMGAGFLLIETKGLTELALIFGSTWIVNAMVFTGLFIAILIANAWVQRHPGFDARMPFAWLLAVLVLKYLFAEPLAAWSATSVGRIAAPVITCGPLLFASVIFARLFASATKSADALGWNIIGGLCGGGLELLAIFLGNRVLNLVAFAIYGAALALHMRALRMRQAAASAISA